MPPSLCPTPPVPCARAARPARHPARTEPTPTSPARSTEQTCTARGELQMHYMPFYFNGGPPGSAIRRAGAIFFEQPAYNGNGMCAAAAAQMASR